MVKRFFSYFCILASVFCIAIFICYLTHIDEKYEPFYDSNPNLDGVKDFEITALVLPEQYKGTNEDIIKEIQKNNFGNYEFYDGLSISGEHFENIIDISKLLVKKGNFYLDDCTFNNEVTFYRCLFDQLDFEKSKFNSTSYMLNCYFINTTNFDNILFNDEASFKSSVFIKDVNFNDVNFKTGVYFNSTIFNTSASFRNLILDEKTKFYFDNARLADTLDFSLNGKIYNDIDLTVADFNNVARHTRKEFDSEEDSYFPHYISLYKTDISKFHIDYKHFRLLKTYKYYDIEKDTTITNTISFDEMSGIYEGLLNNFKNRGQQDSYKLLDIEYKYYKWENSKSPWMNKIEKLWWNYGYDKYLIFKWVVVFMLFFSLITFLSLPYLNSVYTLKKLSDLHYLNFNKITPKALGIRWWFAFVYTSTIFFGLTLKIENIEYKKFWGTLYIVLMYTIGIVCLAYMANFVIQK